MPETISVILGEFRHELEVEERVYADRTCGQYESGWRAYRGDEEYFISDGGEVWAQPHNVVVGIAPKVKEAADRFEAMMDEGISDNRTYGELYYESGIPAGYENDMALD